MLNLLIPILPSLGLLVIIVLGYFIFRQKVNEFNQKFTSMFSLLSAITDEINKLKSGTNSLDNSHLIPVIKEGEDVNESDYETMDDDDDESDYDSDDDDKDEDDDDDDDGDEQDDEDDKVDDEHDIQVTIVELNKGDDLNKELVIVEETDSNYVNLENKEDIVSHKIESDLESKEIVIHEVDPDFNKMSMKELKNLAKAKGIGNDNNSKLKKNELIDLLTNNSMKLE